MKLLILFSALPLACFAGSVSSAPTAANASVQAPIGRHNLNVRDNIVFTPSSEIDSTVEQRDTKSVEVVPDLTSFAPSPACWDCLVSWALTNGWGTLPSFDKQTWIMGDGLERHRRGSNELEPSRLTPRENPDASECFPFCYDDNKMLTMVGNVGFVQTLWEGAWIYELIAPVIHKFPPPPHEDPCPSAAPSSPAGCA
ncbi:hypothetical protein K491DRAFT_718916 [Lophiostoma macrostomum CBS 122681]|uniref:Uncharacterized protein n=1 Tax=Lophiostoma macrostomum CBS 122681 TaxID=1314788 RepID=A0A6A6T0Z2_9PLEO|nr:hypothetical protein K491DRAFT_718916 [Lophiostoma macrostomum CBS 122681]